MSCGERATKTPASPPQRRWRAGGSYGYSWSDLSFGDGLSPSIGRRSVIFTLERRLTPDWTVQLGAGASLWGVLVVEDDRAAGGGYRTRILPGWLGSLSGSYRIVDGTGAAPFVLLSAVLAGSGANTVEPAGEEGAAGSLFAFDIRVGATIGKTLWSVLTPYAAARAFGGPIVWHAGGQTRTGTDRYHFQIAVGTAVTLPAAVDVFAELVPLGERAVALGAGLSF